MWLTHQVFAQSVRDMRCLPAADVGAAADGLLARLLGHAARHVPALAPMAAFLDAAADGDPAAWAALPIQTDADLRRIGPDGFATVLPEGEAPLPGPRSWTSLSTPLDAPLGRLADIADRAQWEFLAHSQAVETTGRLAALLPATSIGPGDIADPVEPWSIDAPRGRAHRFFDHLDPEATLAWLENVRPDGLFAHPAAVAQLLTLARPGRLGLRDILVWQPGRRAGFADECLRVFGARLIEAVVSTAFGLVASAEPTGSFVPALETAHVEVVDPAGHPCGAGQPGRLVATSLYAYHRPVLRHDLGLGAMWDEDSPSDHRPRLTLLT